jgi:hypothetical protein
MSIARLVASSQSEREALSILYLRSTSPAIFGEAFPRRPFRQDVPRQCSWRGLIGKQLGKRLGEGRGFLALVVGWGVEPSIPRHAGSATSVAVIFVLLAIFRHFISHAHQPKGISAVR